MTKVVDASALAAVIFDEPDSESVADRLSGSRLAAPSLIRYEMSNVCVVKCCREPTERDALIAAFGWYERLAIVEYLVEPAGVVELALATGLTSYDASYLWLARELGAALVTLDRKLEQAAASLR